jgi:acetolactate synthase-1/2/3 large subunit
MSKRIRGADIVVRTLEKAGLTDIFTLSGNHIMSLFDAAIDSELKLVHVRHEAATVHMADSYGRLTGRPGIAWVTGGPGHANAVGALFTALGQETPMILMSGHTETDQLGRGGFQELRQVEMAAPVSKAAWMATDTATRYFAGSKRRCTSQPASARDRGRSTTPPSVPMPTSRSAPTWCCCWARRWISP